MSKLLTTHNLISKVRVAVGDYFHQMEELSIHFIEEH
ncbi:hypothetical protein B6N60_05009 [Richelia sinica FACHB-800]|uniref:Uncharacterized protein n=1 Tax=Richelia sinica FACHB-800 TaxID=1357546 RepID=A0A975Y7F5_9NOST|nr:hypothetical protein B6N60_05009 [Richelia sinica FACHB-800]